MGLTRVQLPTIQHPAIPYTHRDQWQYNAALTLDASGEKAAFIGCVYHPGVDTGTISIRKVHFSVGAKTFDAASRLRVSLQNISATAGPPYQPDGTQDQTYDMATLAANGHNTTGSLSADRTVDLSADSPADANSRWLAIVFEYQAFTTGDSVVINSLVQGTNYGTGLGARALLNTGSWAYASGNVPVVILECSDGSFAYLVDCLPYTVAVNRVTTASDGALRRVGAKFKFPMEVKIDRLSLEVYTQNGADGLFVLYDSDGTTVLRSVSLDNDAVLEHNLHDRWDIAFEPVTLAADTFYRAAIVSSTTALYAMNYGDVNASGHLSGTLLGANCHYTAHDGSAWTDTTTRQVPFGVGIHSIHDGTGGGTTTIRGGAMFCG